MATVSRSDLEKQARRMWVEWGDGFALYGTCSCCGEQRHVRGKRRSWVLCLDCFDTAGESFLHRRHAVHNGGSSNDGRSHG